MPETPQRKLAAIMFTDIVGYTALMSQDEEKAFQLLTTQREILKPIVEEFGGSWLKEIGDGLLLTFPTVSNAVRCAIKIQQETKEIEGYRLRIGIHEGEIIEVGGDVFGDDVNVASRIEPFAAPGGIAISHKVREDISSLPEFETKYVGQPKLKGVKQEVRVYCIVSHELPEPDVATVTSKIEKQKPTHFIRMRTLVTLIATAIVLVFAIWSDISSKNAWNAMEGILGGRTEGRLEGRLEERSVAVLPFISFSDSKDDEYFSDGVTEDIITRLTRVKDLRVTPRTTMMQYKGTSMGVPDIGLELGVFAILVGSIRRVGDRVRIVAQLVNALSDEYLWTATYDTNSTDIFAIQSDVAENIAIALDATLSKVEGQSIEHRPTDNTEAYDYYFRAKEYEHRGSSQSDLLTAENLYTRAIELDPTFAEAYAGLENTRFLSIGVNPEERWTQSEILETVRNTIISTNMEEWVEVYNTPKGTTITIDSRRSFEPGSADLKPELYQILDDLIFVMKDPHNMFPIAVEGHTDNIPPSGEIAKKYPSNWEFSQALAAAVVRYLQSQGVPGGKLRAIGQADTIPDGTTWYQTRIGITEHMVQMANTTPEQRAANGRLEITFLAVGW